MERNTHICQPEQNILSKHAAAARVMGQGYMFVNAEVI